MRQLTTTNTSIRIEPETEQLEKEQAVIEYWKKHWDISTKSELIDEAQRWIDEVKEKGLENVVIEGVNSPAFELFSVHEFEHGYLLAEGFSDQYKSFVKNLTLEIQTEYHCSGASEKALAHLMAQSFCRVLQIQNEFYAWCNKSTQYEFSIKSQEILTKELDRALRQYLACLQVLRSLKQPPLNITIRTKTANIANQQLVQENNNA